MIISKEEKLTLIFASDANDTGAIPAPVFGKSIEIVNGIMHAVWDYALTNPEDDRFDNVREITYGHKIRTRDVDYAIVEIRNGSLVVDLGVAIATAFSIGTFSSILINLISSAVWDLTKYGFGGLYELIRHDRKDKENEIIDPLINALLPNYVELVRAAHQSLRDGTKINTRFRYKDLEFTIDSESQMRVIEANYVYSHVTTRLIGSLVGVDYSEKRVKISFQYFPESAIWCDAQELNIRQLNQFVIEEDGNKSSRLGFDVELFWRDGAAKVLPPDSIRIFRIVPPHEFKNPNFNGFPEFSRPATIEYTINSNKLSPVHEEFLKWFSWADEKWNNPVMPGIIAYLRNRKDMEIGQMTKGEIEKIVRFFINSGVILLVQSTNKNEPVLRLCRDHPMVIPYLSRA